MNTEANRQQRAVTPARVVALVLIGIAVVALAWLRFAPESSISVPQGANAGDLVLEDCTYQTEAGSYAADCGTLVVPENRADSNSRPIALPVTRIRARSDSGAEPIFRLEGGPGISNMRFSNASRFADEHDVVLVGYRGVDGSVRLDCPEVESAMKHSNDLLAETSFRARADAFTACADRLTDEGVDLAGYTLPQRVDDLEAARRALGYERIDLLSESAGTRTAMIYSWRYPKSTHRSVLIAVNPPGHFLWNAKTTGEQVRRYAALCAEDESCRSRTPDLAASLHSAYEDIPEHWWFLPIKEGNVRAGAFWGLMHATGDGGGPLTAPLTIDALLSADGGDGGGAWFLSVLAQMAFPTEQVWGDVAAVGRTDAADARRFFADGLNRGSVIGAPGTDLIWFGGRLLDAWPASPDENEYTRVRDSQVETLLIGGNLDFATPPQWATRDLLPHLPNGHEVVLRDLGHSGDFWTHQPEASTRLVVTFLDSGRVDASLYERNRVDFTPSIGYGAIAEIVLGVMVGLAALTVLSLLLMALRVRWRGAFGRKTSGALRAFYAPLLGLGGWFVGVLIVLTAFPAVPIDDELLAALSVGLPIGLGVYLAWVNPDRPASTRATGFAGAVAGALVGASLGFHATEGPVAALTAIVGATVGANLLLLGLDILQDRQIRRRSSASVGETLEARPSPG